MSTIICPVDFKEPSFRAAGYAATIAGKTNSKLIFLHALTESEAQVRDRLSAGIQRIGYNAEHLMGSNFSFLMSKDGLLTSLNQIGKVEDIGLIVMASDGLSNLKEFYEGSHTENVAGKTPYPVLSIPVSHLGDRISSIVFATDYESTSLVDTESLLLFAQVFSARVSVVHVSRSENEISQRIFTDFKDKLIQLFGKEQLNVERVVGEDVETSLLQLAVEEKADLIVVHKDHFDVLDGSKTDTLLRMAEFPVLVLKK